MTYSDFTLNTLLKTFDLKGKQEPLFEHVDAVDIPQWLQETLNKGMELPLNSEKARSELIVMPVLLSCRELCHNTFYIYSGQRFDVYAEKGLIGECDFILANTAPFPTIQAPIITIVEAKKHDVEGGLGQCAAQMVGARLFNQQEGNDIETIFGCVTTGEIWQFLKLENDSICIDTDRYFIDNVGMILGIFQAMVAFYNTDISATLSLPNVGKPVYEK